MALLLHLSDLHLTDDPSGVALADHKVRVVDPADAATRHGRLRSSLEALGRALSAAGKSLDSIVITGDVTDNGSPTGFAILDAAIDALGPAGPARDRILVLPGNHDVDRAAARVGQDRFAQFRVLRARGYRLAWLDEQEPADDTVPQPILAAADGSFILGGLNSANYSGSSLKVEPELSVHLAGLRARGKRDQGIAALLEAWESRGEADLARVGAAQLREMRTLLALTGATPGRPLRIVGLHHPLLPVSTIEEFKSFEPMTNLGELREWLTSNRVDLVLHGHKHHQRRYWDRIASDVDGRNHELAVLSAPSLVDAGAAKAAVGLLLDIPSGYPRAQGIRVIEVPVVSDGAGYELGDLAVDHVTIDTSLRRGLIEGKSVEEVHHKLLALRDMYESLPMPLVCRVEDGSSALRMPSSIPDIPIETDTAEDWFEDTLEWWQRPAPGKAAVFNHGQYLRAVHGEHTAVEAMTAALGKKPWSSRAITVLMDPAAPHIGADFAAFVTVQFVFDGSRVHAIAYFRKQEMPHWWPINVTEIARLQREIITGMHANRQVRAGSITTITAIAMNGQGMPRVAVPQLDRRLDQQSGMLDLVLPLFGLGIQNGGATAAQWDRVFADWRPALNGVADGDPRPKLGIASLRAVFLSVIQITGDDRPELLMIKDALERLDSANSTYADADRTSWAEVVRVQSDRTMEAVRRLLEDTSSPT